jgi:hypothetical protein
MVQYAPSDETELIEQVRALTLYDDTRDELPNATLQTQIGVAQMMLKNKTGSENFYSDSGLGQALLGTTAILAKAAVENYSVDRWSVGADDIDVSGAGDADQMQFEMWNKLINEGLSDSSTQKTASPVPRNSANYIG